MTDLTVSKTILEQLGGRRFIAMTGAKNFLGSNYALSFHLPRNARYEGKTIDRVRVVLDANDTYSLFFSRWNAKDMKMIQVAEANGIYCDVLAEVFTRYTGLATNL
jgi:hypothetical protein